MHIDCSAGHIELVNEPAYTFGSTDNVHRYGFSRHLDREFVPSSVHGVFLNGEPLAVFGDSGGGTAVHAHSAVVVDELLFLAVGCHVVCLRPVPFEFKWALQTDAATCFGVYFDQAHQALISHGELEITRFTEDGMPVWSSSGADIFTEGFTLGPQCIEVRDFEGKAYRFNYVDGSPCV
ncbi:MAG: hypothetical protein BWK76_10575 [Desulfobulbaceae bacterium A2]|nr:MAG: hypothetical protein BWK76_10575 [Desulfobulbaceae bacterium A2]